MKVRSKSRVVPPPGSPRRGALPASSGKTSAPGKADGFSKSRRQEAEPDQVADSVRHFGGSTAYPASSGEVLEKVMRFDLDGDREIDADDVEAARKAGVAFSLEITLPDGQVENLTGPERLAHAADVLATAVRVGGVEAPVPHAALLEPAGAALARSISDAWPAFVRRSSTVPDLVAALKTSNLPAPDGKLHVWVPASDAAALARLTAEAGAYNASRAAEAKAKGQPPPTDTLEVEVFTPGMSWRELDAHKPGILYLPHDFVVPGGRFSEMYGWDSYFIGQGLISSGRTDLARSMVENEAYLVEHYGKIPNSTRSYHLSRSQPPFMPRLALELYEAEPTPRNLELLRTVASAAEKELANVWSAPGQLTASGLSRFHDDATGPDIEVERNLVSQGVFAWPDPEADRAARATGWDLSHRFGDHAQHFEPVDLNSQLYRYEKDLAQIERLVNDGDTARSRAHDAAAEARARVMQERMWSEPLGLFVDYDLREDRASQYETLATFAPLAAGWATPEQAQKVAKALPRFLEAGGLATSSRRSREQAGEEGLQWDWPNGWAPLQVVADEGLRRYGYVQEANELAYRWCSALLSIASGNNGLLPEKIDVHHVSADVAAAEYGNQGADRGSYWVPREENPQGFGWTNASFIKLRAALPEELRQALDRGVRPDALFASPTQGPVSETGTSPQGGNA